MKILVIGLGSMGKRRIRSLKELGFSDIDGFDTKKGRINEVGKKYRIQTISSLTKKEVQKYDAMIISVPPDKHYDYLKLAIDSNKPTFIEAGVISEHSKKIIELNRTNKVFLAPSCTLRFHPIIKDIKDIIKSGKYGTVSNFTFHSGQYLPDWHPWENIKDFYVSNRETGGAREIVPFELTWIVDVFGYPKSIKGFFDKTINLGVNIEDTYSFCMRFERGLGIVTIDVTSRFATRCLIINLEFGQIRWNWEEGMLKVYEAGNKRWVHYYQPEGKAESGYNKNIIEEMYIEEIKSYIDGINDNSKYPYSIEDDYKTLKLLDEIEESDGGFKR